MLQAVTAPTHDRDFADIGRQRRIWAKVRRADIQMARKLRGIARSIGEIVNGLYDPNDPNSADRVREALFRYSELIRPWAKVQAVRMVADVQRRDEAVWALMSRDMSRAMAAELKSAPTGALLRERMDESAALITSLPIDAAHRVHEWTMKGLTSSARADEVSQEILRTGEVTKARANLIARTEVARTAAGLVEARSRYVGSEGYIWRSAGDSDVRNKPDKHGHVNPVGSHRLLNGKYFRWDAPPVASTNGERAHAGMIYQCRCYPEPVIPDELQ